jgi:hypothetical protein
LIYSDLDTVCFTREVLPVFVTNCGVIGCHDQQSASAGYVLTDYNSIVKGVIPYNPEKSIIYKAIIGKGASLMPPGNALSQNDRILIRVWIGQGAVNTSCPVGSLNPGNNSLLIVNN